jgi:hypothetical protein
VERVVDADLSSVGGDEHVTVACDLHGGAVEKDAAVLGHGRSRGC